MKLSTLIRREMNLRGIKTIKQAAQLLGVSTELARSILKNSRIPKDGTLLKMAEALGLDPAVLLVPSHLQKMPRKLRAEVLPVAPPSNFDWIRKRKWPLSQEQCDYLGRVLQPAEIQLIRKCRQLTEEEKGSAVAYVGYLFSVHHVPPPADPPARQQAPSEQEAACRPEAEAVSGGPRPGTPSRSIPKSEDDREEGGSDIPRLARASP